MKKTVITAATFATLLAAGLGLSGAAAAVPSQGASAADTIQSLQDSGYNVQLNGTASAPLSKCRVLGIHGLSGVEMSMDDLMAMDPAGVDTVYVDISCPTLSS